MSATPRLPGALLSPGGWGCHCTLLRLCLVSLPHFCSLLPLKMLTSHRHSHPASLQFQIFYQFLATRRLHSRGTQSQADQFSQVSLHRQGISRPPEPPCWVIVFCSSMLIVTQKRHGRTAQSDERGLLMQSPHWLSVSHLCLGISYIHTEHPVVLVSWTERCLYLPVASRLNQWTSRQHVAVITEADDSFCHPSACRHMFGVMDDLGILNCYMTLGFCTFMTVPSLMFTAKWFRIACWGLKYSSCPPCLVRLLLKYQSISQG